MGNGKELGQGQYHILNIRARERSAGSSGKLGAAGTQCSIGNLDPTPSASLNGLCHLTGPGARGTRAARRTGILGCIDSAHSSHFIGIRPCSGLEKPSLPSCSKMDEDRRQHKTTRALGEIPRWRAK